MDAPAELRHQLFRDLFFAERTRREQIRGSIGVPVSAIAFSVYAFGTLATNLDLDGWQHPSSLTLIASALLAVSSVLAACVCPGRVEWLMLFHEPPDLDELVHAEQQIRAALGYEPGPAGATVWQQYMGMLTGAYDIAYRRQFVGNESERRVPRLGSALRRPGAGSPVPGVHDPAVLSGRQAVGRPIKLLNLLFLRAGGRRHRSAGGLDASAAAPACREAGGRSRVVSVASSAWSTRRDCRSSTTSPHRCSEPATVAACWGDGRARQQLSFSRRGR